MASLNRKKWEEMWKIAKYIENSCMRIDSLTRSERVKIHNNYIFQQNLNIKKLILSVIGQMK